MKYTYNNYFYYYIAALNPGRSFSMTFLIIQYSYDAENEGGEKCRFSLDETIIKLFLLSKLISRRDFELYL